MKNRFSQSGHGCKIRNRISFINLPLMSIIIIVGFIWSGRLVNAGETTESYLEYRIKAAFLFNFCQFVSWPETPAEKAGGPLILCVMGQNPFEIGFETLLGKSIRGRPLEIRYVSNSEAICPCHLLFICKSGQNEPGAIIEKVKSMPVLTVGDREDFARMGGIIAFIKVDGKIRFEINPRAAEAAGLKISSQLLKLAIITDNDRPKEN